MPGFTGAAPMVSPVQRSHASGSRLRSPHRTDGAARRACSLVLCLCLLSLACSAAEPALKLGRPFTQHAVLQRGQPCPIFGSDTPGTRITVSFAGQTVSTVAGPDSQWRVALAPLTVSVLPQTLSVSGSSTVTLTNVLVGDVWLISGQSNADWPLRSAAGGAEAITAATNRFLRYWLMAEAPLTTPAPWPAEQVARLTPDRYFSGEWQPSSPATAGAVSAIGYFFAHSLATNRCVPIGLIDCSVGGTPAESWIPTEALATNPRLKAMTDAGLSSPMMPGFVQKRMLQNLEDWDRAGRPAPMPDHPYKNGACWRLGLASVAPFAIRGVLWYQGETNADFYDAAQFDDMAAWHLDTFRTLVAGWRRAWSNPGLSFYTVQLPLMNRPSWPWFRESQLRAASTISNVSLAVAFDYGNPNDVHPVNKRPVADRLARIALARSYGQSMEWSGPELTRHTVDGSRIRLQFSHTTGGLVSCDGQPLRHFEVAGSDRRFFPATAAISGEAVIVSSPEVAAPAAVRYAWVPVGNVNFFNGAGLPASPFRTDTWPANPKP